MIRKSEVQNAWLHIPKQFVLISSPDNWGIKGASKESPEKGVENKKNDYV